MTTTPTYPGVYINEVPSGNRTLTGVATSITAFVGGATRGLVDEPVPISNFSEFERGFGGLSRRHGLGYAVRDFYLNGGGSALVIRIAPADARRATFSVGSMTWRAASPGAWANRLRIHITRPTPGEATEIVETQGLTPADADKIFTILITDGEEEGAPFEVFRNVTTVDGPARVDRLLASSHWVRTVGAPSGVAPPATGDHPILATGDANVGKDGAALGTTDYLGGPGDGFEDGKKGFFAVRKADLVNLIVIPPPAPAGDLPVEVWTKAMEYAAKHRAFLVVDPPSALTAGGASAWVTGTASLTGLAARNAGFYYPRIRHADPLNGGAIGTFAPSGAVAGAIARTDGTRGVWKAPAGLEAGLTGVVELDDELTDEEQGALNPTGVNVLRTFRGVGSVVWGARTLRGSDVLADDYKYIPVRRLALFLEESLYRGTQWVVFEPNDEPLWSQIRLSVGAFLHDLFSQGAFQGVSPRDAYFVRCDSETTTQYDIDRGIVNIHVGFAPLKPAEFVLISIQQKTAEAAA